MMSDRLDKDQDPSENKNSLTHWEERCLEEFEASNHSQLERIDREYEGKGPIIWVSFQNSASSLANFYKASPTTKPLWVPFQNTATTITALYRDGMDVMKQCFELGKQYGQHKRNDELVAWTKTQRRLLAREDLIGVVCGVSPPPIQRPRHHRNIYHGGRVNGHRHSADRSPRHSTSRSAEAVNKDMQAFCDALAINGLDGAMSNIGIQNGVPPDSAAATGASADMHSDVIEEIRKHRHKRPSSTVSSSSVLDSPTRKRTRLL